MTAQDRFERTVASWLRDDAMPASPWPFELGVYWSAPMCVTMYWALMVK